MFLPLLAAITLSVTTATNHDVTLGWTGATGAVTLERKMAGTPWPLAPATGTIATPATATYRDTTIDAWSTYTYRVKAGATLSNEITVGPPPIGFSGVLRMPAALLSSNSGAFAAFTRLTFDGNGDPLVAYLTTDANGDGERTDGQLFTVSWNRARYHWNEPTKVADVGAVPGSGGNLPFGIARDPASGQFALLYLVNTAHELRLATSPDAQSWTSTLVRRTREDEDPAFASPALAIAHGTLHIAYAYGLDSLVYQTGPISSAPWAWRTTLLPHPETTRRVTPSCVNVVLDEMGAAGVGFCAPPEDGYTTSAWFWRAGPGATRIMDTDNHQTDDPSLSLAQRGRTVAAVFGAARDDRFFADHHFWSSVSRDGGATWSAPVVLADDGGHAMAAPLTVAVHTSARVSAVAAVGGGNDGTARCGQPKLMQSSGGSAWTTCAPDMRGVPATANAAAPTLGVADNDKLYLVFRTTGAAGSIPPGLVLWRER